MEYSRLIREAWALTWHFRFLWLLGFFAGGAVGVAGGNGGQAQWRATPAEVDSVMPGAAAATAAAERWLAANPAVVAAAALLVVVLGLLLLAVCLIAQGGMAQATADLARGRPSSLGQAWRAGQRLVWRYAGLWLLLIVAVVLLAAAIGATVAGMIGLGLLAGSAAPNWTLVVAAGLIALPLIVVGLAAAVVVSVVVAYAQRAIAVEDLGPLAALRAGWRLLRAHPGPSLLTWLVNVGLAIGTAIAVGLAAAGAAGLVAATVALARPTGGAGAPVAALLIVAGLAALVAVVVVTAIANTFFWHYWTLAYLRLGGQGAQIAVTPLGGPGVASAQPEATHS